MVHYIYMENFHQSMVAHALNSTLKRRNLADLHEFDASLVHRVNSRTPRAVTQRTPDLEKKSRNFYMEKNTKFYSHLAQAMHR